LADELGIDKSRFEFKLLYGMAAPIKRALVDLGYRVREYSPVGELLPGMSYLVRRLLENTSNEGFLRAKFSDHVSTAELLRDPRELVNGVVPAAGREGLAGDTPASTGASDFSCNGATLETPPSYTYKNASLVNSVYPECQEKMRTALREERARFG